MQQYGTQIRGEDDTKGLHSSWQLNVQGVMYEALTTFSALNGTLMKVIFKHQVSDD